MTVTGPADPFVVILSWTRQENSNFISVTTKLYNQTGVLFDSKVRISIEVFVDEDNSSNTNSCGEGNFDLLSCGVIHHENEPNENLRCLETCPRSVNKFRTKSLCVVWRVFKS